MTYRPYQDADEYVSHKGQANYVRAKNPKGVDYYYLIGTLHPAGCSLENKPMPVSWKELFEQYTYLDGSPCGVKVL